MLLKQLDIKYFRGIHKLSLQLDKTTVLIGENNTGKSTILGAIQACMGGSALQNSEVFTEYDYHLSEKNSQPGHSDPIEITLRFAFDAEDADEISRLGDIIQAYNNQRYVIFRVKSKYDHVEENFVTTYDFMNINNEELKLNTQRYRSVLRQIVSVFYLKALRDATKEFRPNSKFWRPFIRSTNMDPSIRRQLENELSALNKKITSGHEPFRMIEEQFGELAKLAPLGPSDSVSVEAIPGKAFDTLAQAQVILSSSSGVGIPVHRHGEGTQSLAVIYLFGAFLSGRLHKNGSGNVHPILTLEEPEAHLHPSAIRSVTRVLDSMPGQKIITTHSGDLVSRIPIECLRRLRRKDGAITICQIADEFSTEEWRQIRYHVQTTRGNLFFARCWLLVEGLSDRLVFEHCADMCGYDLAHEGVFCIEYAQSNGAPLIKFAKQMGIEWFSVSDGDQSGEKYIRGAKEQLDGQDDDQHLCKLDYDSLEILLCMNGYGSIYLNNISPQKRRNINYTKDTLDYWKQVIKMQAGRGPWKVPSVEKVIKLIKDKDYVPGHIRNIIERAVYLARGAG